MVKSDHNEATRKILIVSGTRPEIIKLAPVYFALRDCDWARVTWVHTGQHGDMADQMLETFGIQPDYVIPRHGSELLEFSLGCRRGLDVILQEKPCHAVIVQGDTESAFLGALAGFYAKVPVAHVEAGLRTHDLSRPFPEEGLRQMISRIASFHFAPTARAVSALHAEGIRAESVWQTGNTVVDAQQWIARKHDVRKRVPGRGHILVTMHRREHWGDAMQQACTAIAQLARRYPSLDVLFPVHLNPIVGEMVHAELSGLPNVKLCSPLGYLEMQQALADAWLVLTDSGGLQEEAPTYRVPVLVLRNETERPEIIGAGCGALIGTQGLGVMNAVENLLTDELAYRRMQVSVNPFGDGTASLQIALHLQQSLAMGEPGVPSDGGAVVGNHGKRVEAVA